MHNRTPGKTGVNFATGDQRSNRLQQTFRLKLTIMQLLNAIYLTILYFNRSVFVLPSIYQLTNKLAK